MARESPSWSSLLGIGSASGAILLLSIGLGWFLDSILNTSPALVLVGVVVGIAAAVSSAYVQIRKYLS